MIALSWSRWSDYDQCPLKFALKYIRKAPNFQEPSDPSKKSPHLVRGENLHKQLEKYVEWKNGQLAQDPQYIEMVQPAMSPETAALIPVLDNLISTSRVVLPESQIAIDAEWKQVEWFSKQAYFRSILDLIAGRENHAIVWDYKSGKYQPYTDECGQLHLSAAIVLLLKPEFEYVDVSYLFLDEKKPEGKRIYRNEVIEIKAIFDDRHKRVNSDTQWNPKKNDNCGWCAATKDQCRYSKKF